MAVRRRIGCLAPARRRSPEKEKVTRLGRGAQVPASAGNMTRRCAVLPAKLALAALVTAAGTLTAQTEPAALPLVVVGRVVDERGEPVRGAAVGADTRTPLDPAALMASPPCTTDDNGRFRLTTARLPGRWVYVRAVAVGREAEQLWWSDAGSARELEIRLLPGTELRGVIRDADGAPLRGASIEAGDAMTDVDLHYPAWLRTAGLRTAADEKGRFRLPGVARTGLRVIVTHPGFYTCTHYVHTNELLVVTMERSGRVRGRVVGEDGAPRAGVSLGDHGLITGPDGRFDLPVSTRGPFRIGGAETEPVWRPYRSERVTGPAEDVEVKFEPPLAPPGATGPPACATLVCVDAATRAPVAEFRASVQPPLAGGDAAAFSQHLVGRYARKGGLQVAWQPGVRDSGRVIVVDAAGYAFSVQHLDAAPPDPWIVELVPESTITGRVLDAATNAPLADAAVVALPAGIPDGWPGQLMDAARTDAEGRYRVRGLRAGDYVVQAFAADRPASAPAAVRVAAGASAAADLAAPPARWVEVVVKDKQAVPKGRARVQMIALVNPPPASPGAGCYHWQLQCAEATWRAGEASCRVGPLECGPVQLQLRFLSRARRCGTAATFDVGTADGSSFELTMPAARPQLVRGTIAWPSNESTARIGVRAVPVDRERRPGPLVRRGVVAGVEADGAFALDLLPGEWQLQLVDVATDLVFHSEPDPIAVVAGMSPIRLEPQPCWLSLRLTSAAPEHLATISDVRLRGGEGVGSAGTWEDWPLQGTGEATLTIHDILAGQRWLVPRTRLTLVAYREELLESGSSSCEIAGHAMVVPDGPAVEVSIAVRPRK